MRIGRANLLNLGLVILSFAVAAALYNRLPPSIPIHWNAAGEANGFAPKSWGAFLMPVVTAALYLLFRIVPRISPNGFRVARFRRVYEIFETAILAFQLFVTVLILLAGAGVKVPMARAVYAGVGLLFVVLGNFMGKITRNFFVGIRTPWTLASDEVWLRTHRLGGKLFVLAGLGLCASGLLGGGLVPLLAAIAIAGVVPVIYSYFLYRRIEGRPTDVRVPPGR